VRIQTARIPHSRTYASFQDSSANFVVPHVSLVCLNCDLSAEKCLDMVHLSLVRFLKRLGFDDLYALGELSTDAYSDHGLC
jgi:hypothetical protein